MKLLVAAFAVMTLVMAAPTPPSVAQLFKHQNIDPILESMCLHMSLSVCQSTTGFGNYDSANVNGICFCAEKPSEFVLARPEITKEDRINAVAEQVIKDNSNLDSAMATFQGLSASPAEKQEMLLILASIITEQQAFRTTHDLYNKYNIKMWNKVKRQIIASTLSTSLDPAAPTFIPPPKTDQTPALLNQSISTQPENTGLVTGAILIATDGVLTFTVQLDGPVAPVIPINASTSFPCGAIGKGPDPNIVIGPKYVEDGTQQTVVADCIVVAVNMYVPGFINYYVLNPQGEVFSLIGSIKIKDLNKIDVSAPTALTLQSSATWTKRDIAASADYLIPKRHQVFKVECEVKCTDRGYFIAGLDDFCGCIQFEDADNSLKARSGISAPDMTEATMSAKACAAMTCFNNGGKPAVFNPFLKTCYCVDQPFVEDLEGGWAGKMA